MATSDSINKGIAKATQLAGLANMLSGGALFGGGGLSPSKNKDRKSTRLNSSH